MDLLCFQLPFNYTGADFYALCTDAMLNGIKRKIAELDAAYGKESTLDLQPLAKSLFSVDHMQKPVLSR